MATTFSRTARSERHFTALLLPHLLMSNNFAGSRALFKKLGLYEGKAFDPSDIEIVAELNPMRDVVGRSTNPNAAPPGEQGQVVPDLFVRIGDSALSIEAKFFTHPSASAVAYQLRSQRKAIEMVLPHTKYERCTFHYLVLTVLPLDDLAEWDANTSRMTWSEVIKVIETVINADSSPDAAYALEELRVRPETLCRITEFSEHESNGRELDEGERVAVEVLPVLGQSAAAVEPGDGAFDHPTPGLDDEALHPIGSLDDLGLEIGQDAGQGAVKDRPLIGAVGEQFPEKGKQTEQGRQQRETAVAILNVGGGDDAVQQQALRIDQNMPLLALDQLAGIEAVAVDASPPFSALFTL